jgi:hypothetical protein
MNGTTAVYVLTQHLSGALLGADEENAVRQAKRALVEVRYTDASVVALSAAAAALVVAVGLESGLAQGTTDAAVALTAAVAALATGTSGV